jgi:uncharacterized protein (TIGR02001 family)
MSGLAGAALTAAACAVPASAQVAVEGALLSDYRVRGYSVSGGDPAAALSLSYDDASGVYLGATAIGGFHGGAPELSGFQADAGYALRLGPGVSLDAGLSRSVYYYYASDSRRLAYTEAYLGLAVPHVSARVSYSPGGYRSAGSTLYAEIDGGIEPAADWVLSAHAGAFRYLGARPNLLQRERYDWRIGAARKFGASALHLDLTGRAHGSGPARRKGDSAALVVSLTHGF